MGRLEKPCPSPIPAWDDGLDKSKHPNAYSADAKQKAMRRPKKKVPCPLLSYKTFYFSLLKRSFSVSGNIFEIEMIAGQLLPIVFEAARLFSCVAVTICYNLLPIRKAFTLVSYKLSPISSKTDPTHTDLKMLCDTREECPGIIKPANLRHPGRSGCFQSNMRYEKILGESAYDNG